MTRCLTRYVAILLACALILPGCRFILHEVSTTAEVVPVNIVKLETGVQPQTLIDNPDFWLNLAKLIPFTELFSNKTTLQAAITGDVSLGIPVGMRLTRHHRWLVWTSEENQ